MRRDYHEVLPADLEHLVEHTGEHGIFALRRTCCECRVQDWCLLVVYTPEPGCEVACSPVCGTCLAQVAKMVHSSPLAELPGVSHVAIRRARTIRNVLRSR